MNKMCACDSVTSLRKHLQITLGWTDVHCYTNIYLPLRRSYIWIHFIRHVSSPRPQWVTQFAPGFMIDSSSLDGDRGLATITQLLFTVNKSAAAVNALDALSTPVDHLCKCHLTWCVSFILKMNFFSNGILLRSRSKSPAESVSPLQRVDGTLWVNYCIQEVLVWSLLVRKSFFGFVCYEIGNSEY